MSTTFDELEADLKAWLEDDDTEFDADIPKIIELGEFRLIKDLNLSIFNVTQSANTADGTETLTKPTGSVPVVFQSLWYGTAPNITFLELRSVDFVRDYQSGVEGPPRYYAESSTTEWLLGPIPDATYAVSCRGIVRPTGLASGTQSTWLSTHMSDILLKACLAESEAFLKSDDRVQLWEADYQKLLPSAKRELYELLNQHYNLTPLQVPAQPTNAR